MKFFTRLQKLIILTIFAINLLLPHASFAQAKSTVLCDYDEMKVGVVTIKVVGDNYTLELDSESGNSYTYTGSTQEVLVAQVQTALASAKPDMYGITNIALMLSMNKPVCASAIESASLYVQPGILEKKTYYAVGVCTPETSDCWTMKITKGTPMAAQVKKDTTLELEGKVCIITSSPDGEIFYLYEDENADY